MSIIKSSEESFDKKTFSKYQRIRKTSLFLDAVELNFIYVRLANNIGVKG